MTFIPTLPFHTPPRAPGPSRCRSNYVRVISSPLDRTRDIFLPEPKARRAFELGRLGLIMVGGEWEYCLNSVKA